MRKITCFVLAAALAAAPALAQNEATAENAVDANANATLPVDNGVVAANDLAAVPEAVPVAAEPVAEPAPAPARSTGGSIPWGAIGLVGLIGLMGRKRRD